MTMSANGKPSSPILLKDYVNILKLAAGGELENHHKMQGVKRRLTKELMDEGLLSENRIDFGGKSSVGIVEEMMITPSGAIALENWSTLLRESSLLYKVQENLGRLFWVIVGALIASASEILGYIST